MSTAGGMRFALRVGDGVPSEPFVAAHVASFAHRAKRWSVARFAETFDALGEPVTLDGLEGAVVAALGGIDAANVSAIDGLDVICERRIRSVIASEHRERFVADSDRRAE